MQKTVWKPVSFEGVGLHSGAAARMRVLPAGVDHGISFRRTDLPEGQPAEADTIPALWHHVHQSPLCTRLENAHGVTISTVEHIMAALMGCGIHNAVIELDGPEVPILDGSSAQFVRELMAAGIRTQDVPVRILKVLRPVEVRRGDAMARLSPAPTLTLDFTIEFTDAAIGRQHKQLNMSNGSFIRELSHCRTFCRQADVETMRANGLALGGTTENAVVVDGPLVLSPGGFRCPDEAVRHKMLDALGDLGLAGAPILGHYQGLRAGHALTNQLLIALFADPANYRFERCDARCAARLPGAGIAWNEIPHVA